MVVHDGGKGKKLPVASSGNSGVYKISDSMGEKLYFLTGIHISPSGEISFGPAQGNLQMIDNQLPLYCRSRLHTAIHQLVHGKMARSDVFIATGVVPLTMFSREQLIDINIDPDMYVAHKGNVIAIPVKAKTDIDGVPIGAANSGGMLHRKNINNPFSQSLFVLEGIAKQYAFKEELLDLIAPFSFGGLPVIMTPNLSSICPRIEASAVNAVYHAPSFGSRFLQEFFCKASQDKPPGEREFNRIFLAGILVKTGMPKVIAVCDHKGFLCPSRSSVSPHMINTHIPDEHRVKEPSDAPMGMAFHIWHQVAAAEAAKYCDLGEVAQAGY